MRTLLIAGLAQITLGLLMGCVPPSEGMEVVAQVLSCPNAIHYCRVQTNTGFNATVVSPVAVGDQIYICIQGRPDKWCVR